MPRIFPLICPETTYPKRVFADPVKIGHPNKNLSIFQQHSMTSNTKTSVASRGQSENKNSSQANYATVISKTGG